MDYITLFRELISPDNIKVVINNLIILIVAYRMIKPEIMAETKRLIEASMAAINKATMVNTAYNIKELADKILKAKKINPKDVEMLLMLLPPYLEGGGNGLAQALADKAVNKFTNETPAEE